MLPFHCTVIRVSGQTGILTSVLLFSDSSPAASGSHVVNAVFVTVVPTVSCLFLHQYQHPIVLNVKVLTVWNSIMLLYIIGL